MATDQEIRDAGFKYVPQQQYLLNPFELPEDQEPVVNQGIVNTNAFTNSGGGGGYYPGSPNELIGNYQSIVDARQQRLNNPSDTFLGFNTMRDQQLTGADAGFYDTIPQEMTMMGKVQDFFTPQSADQIISEGYEEPRFQPGIIGMLAGKIDNYRNLPQGDQAFIARNMGYTGPTVFGANNSGLSKDVFGINTRSLKGNYGEFVGNKVTDLTDMLSKTQAEKYGKGTSGISFNAETGMFEAIDDKDEKAIEAALKATQMNKMNIATQRFYLNKVDERDADRKAVEEAAAAAAAKEQASLNAAYIPQTKTQKEAGGGGGGQFDGAKSKAEYDKDPTGYSGSFRKGGLASIL